MITEFNNPFYKVNNFTTENKTIYYLLVKILRFFKRGRTYSLNLINYLLY